MAMPGMLESLAMAPDLTSSTNPAKRTNDTKPGVTINILVPMALHRQLRLRALQQDMMMKDAVVAAIEDWVAPVTRHAKTEPDLTQVRAEARALGMEELATMIIEGQGNPRALLHEAQDAAGRPRTYTE